MPEGDHPVNGGTGRRPRWRAIVGACVALTVVVSSASGVSASPDSVSSPDAASSPSSAARPDEGLSASPVDNVFPVPNPYEVTFTDSWHACRDGCARQHKGNDLMADEGTPLVAVESGTIVKANQTERGLGGITLWLLGDSGVAYYYAHNVENLVTEGQQVARGQMIARVGNTGNARSTPPHVHFQINLCGETSSAEPCTVDPHPYLLTWAQGLVDGGVDGIGWYQPSTASFGRRNEAGSPLPAFAPAEVDGSAEGDALAGRSDAADGAGEAGGAGGAEARLADVAGGADPADLVPVAGDWDGDGRDTLGLYSRADATFTLLDAGGSAVETVQFGEPGKTGVWPIAGDFDGDGNDTVGLFRPGDATFVVLVDDGVASAPIELGEPGRSDARPVVGDWDGDGKDGLGLFHQSDGEVIRIDDEGEALDPVMATAHGPKVLPVAGDWNGDGRDEVGVVRRGKKVAELPLPTPDDAATVPAAWGQDGAEVQRLVEAEAEAEQSDERDGEGGEDGGRAGEAPDGEVAVRTVEIEGDEDVLPVAGDWNGRDLVSLDELRQVFGPIVDDPKVAEGLPGLNAAMLRAGISTPARKAAFLATLRSESAFLYDAVEAGNDERYRGRGFIQLTGQPNYTAAGEDLELDLVDEPDLAINGFVSPAVAAWYWTVARNINLSADAYDMAAVNIAVGYAPSMRRDMVRCADFLEALRYFSGDKPPDDVNCERTLESKLRAFASTRPFPFGGGGTSAPSGTASVPADAVADDWVPPTSPSVAPADPATGRAPTPPKRPQSTTERPAPPPTGSSTTAPPTSGPPTSDPTTPTTPGPDPTTPTTGTTVPTTQPPDPTTSTTGTTTAPSSTTTTTEPTTTPPSSTTETTDPSTSTTGSLVPDSTTTTTLLSPADP